MEHKMLKKGILNLVFVFFNDIILNIINYSKTLVAQLYNFVFKYNKV